MSFSGKGGFRLDLTKVPTANGWKSPAVPLFSESTGRILVEVDPEFAADFETAMDGFPCACIGGVTEEKRLLLRRGKGAGLRHSQPQKALEGRTYPLLLIP